MDEWGRWECPACAAENEDPNHITETVCFNCGNPVILTPVDDDGLREAYNLDQ